MKTRLRAALAAVTVAASCLLTGCSSFRLVTSPEELYAPPQLPAEYTELNSAIRALLTSGMEYAAPISGSNTQTVQLHDLDGDGVQEALAFLRSPAEEQPLRIHIFRKGSGGYEPAAVIAGSGTDIYSFAARDLNGDGLAELLIGWKTGAELRALSVWTARDEAPQELLRAAYAKYDVTDLDGDGLAEVTVFRSDEQGAAATDLYIWNEGMLEKTSEERLSYSLTELAAGRVVSGVLRDGTPALFAVGVSGYGAAVTDILLLREGQLTNAARSPNTGITTEIYRHRGLWPCDLDGDGVTEIPAAAVIPAAEEEDETEYCRVDWYSHDSGGFRETALSTYHNTIDGWYLELPAGWAGKIALSRGYHAADEMAVTVYDRESGAPLVRICAITGSSRELKASRGNRIILSRQTDVIYVGELLEGNAGRKDGIDEDRLRESFHIIAKEWSSGDY